MPVDMTTRWREKGFLECPVLHAATGEERLFRLWGGWSLEFGEPGGDGVFLTLTRPASRLEAERAAAVMEYGNSVRHITEFSIQARTPMWVGRVHPGERAELFKNEPGSQVFVEREYFMLLKKIGEFEALPDDMGGAWVVRSKRFPKTC